MKINRLILFTACFLLGLSTAFAQAPQQFNYQGAARNANGTPLANKTISLRLSILDGSANGSAQYTETRNVTTNLLGLYNVIIGSAGATSTSGNFTAITWGSGLKYIKVEVDVNNGTNFSVAGTAQLLSVPYALYANNSPAGATGATGPKGDQGPKEDTGSAGPQGAQGIPGIKGDPGAIGAQGPAGAVGAIGATGAQGAKGDTGPIGLQGAQGSTGVAGSPKTADNGLTIVSDNIRLGGDLITPTTITTSVANTLKIAGLQTGTATDNIIVADGTGVLKTVPSSTLAQDLRLIGTANHITVDAGVGSNGTSVGTGNNNIGIGAGTLRSNTSGYLNIGIGAGALQNNQTGTYHLAIGANSLQAFSNTISQSPHIANVSLGGYSLYQLASGTRNVAIGPYAGMLQTSGNDNIFIGADAKPNVSNTGDSQINIGDAIYGDHGKIGFGNDAKIPSERLDVANGNLRIRDINALAGAATDNIVVADATGILKTVPSSTLVQDLRLVGTRNHITVDAGVGNNGTNVGAGVDNIAISSGTLSANTTGYSNIALGYFSQNANTTGYGNVSVGANSLVKNVSGVNNTAFGDYALRNSTSSNNVAIGAQTLVSTTTGGDNTAVGLGASFRNTTGGRNTAVGFNALYRNTTGINNTVIGSSAGNVILGGSNNIVIGNLAEVASGAANDQMSIGNIIFGTGVNGTVSAPAGNVGIGTPAPNSTLHVNGSVATKTRVITTGATILDTDYTLIVQGDCTLPAAAATNIGRIYVLTLANVSPSVFDTPGLIAWPKVTGSFINSFNQVSSSYTLIDNETITIQSDGANWRLINRL